MILSPAEIAGYGLELILAALAMAFAQRTVFHRPFAVLAVTLAMLDPGRAALACLKPYGGHGHGFGRALMGLDMVAWSVEPLGLAVVSLATLEPRFWAHAAGASLALVAALLVRWPWGPPQGALVAVQALSLIIVGGVLVRELRRRWLRWAGRPSTIAIAIAAAGQLSALLGPWLAPSVWKAWRESISGTVAFSVALVFVHAAWLADDRKLTPPA